MRREGPLIHYAGIPLRSLFAADLWWCCLLTPERKMGGSVDGKRCGSQRKGEENILACNSLPNGWAGSPSKKYALEKFSPSSPFGVFFFLDFALEIATQLGSTMISWQISQWQFHPTPPRSPFLNGQASFRMDDGNDRQSWSAYSALAMLLLRCCLTWGR